MPNYLFFDKHMIRVTSPTTEEHVLHDIVTKYLPESHLLLYLKGYRCDVVQKWLHHYSMGFKIGGWHPTPSDAFFMLCLQDPQEIKWGQLFIFLKYLNPYVGPRLEYNAYPANHILTVTADPWKHSL